MATRIGSGFGSMALKSCPEGICKFNEEGSIRPLTGGWATRYRPRDLIRGLTQRTAEASDPGDNPSILFCPAAWLGSRFSLVAALPPSGLDLGPIWAPSGTHLGPIWDPSALELPSNCPRTGPFQLRSGTVPVLRGPHRFSSGTEQGRSALSGSEGASTGHRIGPRPVSQVLVVLRRVGGRPTFSSSSWPTPLRGMRPKAARSGRSDRAVVFLNTARPPAPSRPPTPHARCPTKRGPGGTGCGLLESRATDARRRLTRLLADLSAVVRTRFERTP